MTRWRYIYACSYISNSQIESTIVSSKVYLSSLTLWRLNCGTVWSHSTCHPVSSGVHGYITIYSRSLIHMKHKTSLASSSITAFKFIFQLHTDLRQLYKSTDVLSDKPVVLMTQVKCTRTHSLTTRSVALNPLDKTKTKICVATAALYIIIPEYNNIITITPCCKHDCSYIIFLYHCH